MVSPYKIKYAGIFSNELNMPDLIMNVAFDSDDGETQTYLNRSAIQSESYDGRYKNTVRYKYDEVFAPKFTFMKKDFEGFSMDEVRFLLKYLTSVDSTSLLEVYYDDSNVVAWAAIGGWTEIQLYKMANNRTVAVTAMFSSIMPFALSDLYTVTQNVATTINTTMYYWISTTVSGTTAPQYLLTKVRDPKIGTEVYSVSRAITNTVIDVPTVLYGTISAVNEDGSYIVENTTLKLTLQGTKTKRTYNNKIVIKIDTDDNKPVYPRITINHGYGNAPHTIVPVTPETVYTAISDMVPNTVYFNGTTYYWKTAPSTDEAYFNASTTNPNLTTTSVRIRNTHTDFFNQSSVLDNVVIQNNTPTERIILDGANKITASDNTKRIFGDDFNWQWLELYDGKNEITIEGNCEVTLSWREARKIGEY